MTEQQRYEWIERYLLGELSGEERASFEAQMQRDADFAREVGFQRELLTAVSNREATAFRQQVDRLQEKVDREQEPSVAAKGKQRRWIVFFTLLLLILAALFAYFLLRNPAPQKPQKIYAYAEKQEWPVYPGVLFPEEQVRAEEGGAASGEYASGIRELKTAYARGDYETALEQLQQLPVDSVGADRYFFYRGLLQMRSGQPGQAAASFERVGAGSRFTNPARWNRALSLIAAGRPDSAVPILESFANNDFKAEAARRLLELLSGTE